MWLEGSSVWQQCLAAPHTWLSSTSVTRRLHVFDTLHTAFLAAGPRRWLVRGVRAPTAFLVAGA